MHNAIGATSDRCSVTQESTAGDVDHWGDLTEDTLLLFKLGSFPEVDMLDPDCQESLVDWAESAVEDLVRSTSSLELLSSAVGIEDTDGVVVVIGSCCQKSTVVTERK